MDKVKKSKGFTLVELIITVAVLSIMMISVGAAMSGFMNRSARLRQRERVHEYEHSARLALLAMARDIRQSHDVERTDVLNFDPAEPEVVLELKAIADDGTTVSVIYTHVPCGTPPAACVPNHTCATPVCDPISTPPACLPVHTCAPPVCTLIPPPACVPVHICGLSRGEHPPLRRRVEPDTTDFPGSHVHAPLKNIKIIPLFYDADNSVGLEFEPFLRVTDASYTTTHLRITLTPPDIPTDSNQIFHCEECVTIVAIGNKRMPD